MTVGDNPCFAFNCFYISFVGLKFLPDLFNLFIQLPVELISEFRGCSPTTRILIKDANFEF